MHDPSTVAFDIPNPLTLHRSTWPGDGGRWRMSALITIWHEDPETDGSDDSCGYSSHRISPLERARIDEEATREYKFYMGEHGYLMHPIEAVFMLWKRIAWTEARRQDLTSGEIERVLLLACNPVDNLRSTVAWAQDPDRTEEQRIENFVHLWKCVYRCYRTYHRHWWERPRWHVHHWRLQIHPLQNFKRWAFSRCCRCGKRFAWGYSVCTDQWNGGGPVWFRSEKSVYHADCAKPRSSGLSTEKPAGK